MLFRKAQIMRCKPIFLLPEYNNEVYSITDHWFFYPIQIQRKRHIILLVEQIEMQIMMSLGTSSIDQVLGRNQSESLER